MTNHGVTMTNYDDNYYGAFLAESLSVHKDCLKCVKFLYSKGPLIIYCTGGAFKFFKGNTERNTEKIREKTLVVLKMYHKTT
jgi:hypothetical protein